jgi:dihydrofolate synthase/folylpolyglutamate synthase
MKISSITQAEDILREYVPGILKTGDNQSLERMWPLLKAVGSPQDNLQVIHVAGTSGKTSTCYYIASLLRASGKNVGLTVSPHVDTITERIQINGAPISDEQFCSDLGEFLDIVQGIDPAPSYFELLIVFVLWEFVRYDVDYVVLETGMGGLLDGSNVVTRHDKVCVITDIGYDHMHILGNTLAEIATQKAGIIHKNNAIFTHQQPDDIIAEFERRCDEKSATLNVLDAVTVQPLIARNSQLALFQQRNWQLAKQVAAYVSNRDDFVLADFDPSSVVVPGRMEVTPLDGQKFLVMDGAHNGQKMQAFVQSFQDKFPNKKATVMLALKKGKEHKDVLDQLKPITNHLIVTTFSSYQDLPFTSQDPGIISQYALEIGIDAVVISDPALAYKALLDTDNLVKIITGSFYLLGQVRKL